MNVSLFEQWLPPLPTTLRRLRVHECTLASIPTYETAKGEQTPLERTCACISDAPPVPRQLRLVAQLARLAVLTS